MKQRDLLSGRVVTGGDVNVPESGPVRIHPRNKTMTNRDAAEGFLIRKQPLSRSSELPCSHTGTSPDYTSLYLKFHSVSPLIYGVISGSLT